MSIIKQILVKIAFIFYFMLSFVMMILLYFLDLVISVIGEFSKLTRWHFGEKKSHDQFWQNPNALFWPYLRCMPVGKNCILSL